MICKFWEPIRKYLQIICKILALVRDRLTTWSGYMENVKLDSSRHSNVIFGRKEWFANSENQFANIFKLFAKYRRWFGVNQTKWGVGWATSRTYFFADILLDSEWSEERLIGFTMWFICFILTHVTFRQQVVYSWHFIRYCNCLVT